MSTSGRVRRVWRCNRCAARWWYWDSAASRRGRSPRLWASGWKLRFGRQPRGGVSADEWDFRAGGCGGCGADAAVQCPCVGDAAVGEFHFGVNEASHVGCCEDVFIDCGLSTVPLMPLIRRRWRTFSSLVLRNRFAWTRCRGSRRWLGRRRGSRPRC